MLNSRSEIKKVMMRIQRYAFVLLLFGSLAACTAGSTTAPSITQQNPLDPNFSKVQLAVGTANIYGVTSGLNVVSTLRQPNGQSAVGVNTPTLVGSFAFTAGAVPGVGGALADPYTTVFNAGPSLSETTGSPRISGTLQSVHPGTPNCDGTGAVPAGFISCPAGIAPNTTSFGQSGGVFAIGFLPANAVPNTGQGYSYAPYPQPMYDTTGHTLLIPWGGPPAFNPDNNGMGTRDGLIILGIDSFNLPYFLGVAEGITAFEGVTPAIGAYTLNVQIAFLNNSGQPVTGTVAASARLGSLALLPTVVAPLVTPNGSGDGGATFTAALPAGVTEAYIQIVDYGPGAGPAHGPGTAANCHGPKGTAFAPVYYTVHVTSSGPAVLPALNGPNCEGAAAPAGCSTPGAVIPSPSICTGPQNAATGHGTVGDNFTVQMIGFNYPAYQVALGLTQATTPQTPQLAGPSGQSDITLSLPVEEDPPYTTQTPLSSRRLPIPLRSSHARPVQQLSPDVYRRLGMPAPAR